LGGPDVLIVGAGPAGSCAGLVLARAGARVRIVDRATFPRDKLCGDTVNPGALARLRALGVAGEVEARGLAVGGMLLTGERGVAVDGRYPDGVCGRAILRRDLDWILLQHAVAAGCQVDEGVHVRHARVDDSTGVPRVTGVDVSVSGRHVTFSAPIVIAADGRHSTLAFGLGLARHPRRPRRWAIGGYFADFAPADRQMINNCLPDRQPAIIASASDPLVVPLAALGDSQASPRQLPGNAQTIPRQLLVDSQAMPRQFPSDSQATPRQLRGNAEAMGSGVGLTLGEMHVRRGRYIGVAPVPGALTNVCLVKASGPADPELADPRALLNRELARDPMLRGRAAGARLVSAPVVLGPLAVDAVPAAIDGLLVAGDAAGFVDPMTGDGLRFAIRGAELAAAAALDALAHGWSGLHARLAETRAREFGGKWRFNRALRALVASPRAIDAATLGARVAPALFRALIAHAGDCHDAC
jgi:flavin-dependent dehydrogenase